jgi:hypothetical protein
MSGPVFLKHDHNADYISGMERSPYQSETGSTISRISECEMRDEVD